MAGNVKQEDIELAQKVQEKYGVPASIVLAQKYSETGWDESTVGKNNFFNIKGNGTGGYADYSSKEESFMAYGELLSKDRYTTYTENAKTPESYISGVKEAGYAEDPNYVTKVLNVIESNNLTQYDSDGTWVSGVTHSESSESSELKWYGDLAIVILSIILIIITVVFLALSVTNNSISEVMKNPEKIIKKVVK